MMLQKAIALVQQIDQSRLNLFDTKGRKKERSKGFKKVYISALKIE